MTRTLRIIKKIMNLFTPKGLYLFFSTIVSFANQRTRTDILKDIIIKNGYSSFIEVGVWKGDNIKKIAKRFTHLKCIGVDAYDPSLYSNQIVGKDSKSISLQNDSEIVYRKVKKLSNKIDNFELLRLESIAASKLFVDESIDLIFLDANHSYMSVKEDIYHWLKKVRSGGVLAGHDYSITYFGVIKAVNEVLGVDNVIINPDDTWIYYK